MAEGSDLKNLLMDCNWQYWSHAIEQILLWHNQVYIS